MMHFIHRLLVAVFTLFVFTTPFLRAVAASPEQQAMVVNAQINTVWESPDQRVMLAGGSDSALWFSEDHGLRWTQAEAPVGGFVSKFIGHPDGSIVFAILGESFLRSEDGGRHWQAAPVPDGHYISDVMYLPARRAWLATSGLGILLGDEQGKNWRVIYRIKRKAPLLHLALTSQGGVLAGGGDGLLVSSTDGKVWREIDTHTNAIMMHFVATPDGKNVVALWHDGHYSRISADFKKVSHGETGQAEAPYVAKLDPVHRQILVGTANGEVLRSVDGLNWQRSMIGERAYVMDVEVLPDSGDILVVGARANIARSSDGGQTWKLVHGNEWSSRLMTLHRSPDGALLVAGGGGLMLRSQDQGQTWQTLQPDLARYVSESLGLDVSGALLVVGYDGLIARSDNGARNWQLIETGMSTTLSIQTLVRDGSRSRLLASAPLSTILVSTDQGLHWQANELGESAGSSFLQRFAINDQTILAMGNPGSIIRSADAGHHWQVSEAPAGEDGFADVLALENGVFLAARRDGNILRSADDGKTWRQIAQISKSLMALQVDEKDHVIWAMDRKAFLRSNDQGLSWKPVVLPPGAHVGYLLRTEAGTLLGFGDAGSIVRSTDGGQHWQQLGFINKSSLRKPQINPETHDIWVPGRDGTLLVSRDDGQHWTLVPTRTRLHLNRVAIDLKNRVLIATGEAIVRLPL
ncbi:MAG: hypothetical protein H6R19_3208 [Proteobacteria bacterium]|nr:hypothetical protein [Pseudomonadota bacterium]